VLVPGGRLVGRVRDEAGAPLAGARIRVESSIEHHMSFLARLVAGAVSDDKGAFEVPCVPRCGLRVTVVADGYVGESRLVAQRSSSFTLHRVGLVRGKVVDAAGAPLAGIHVNGVTVETRDAHQSVTTAADGTFAITVPKKGRFRVSGYETRPPHRQFSSGLLRGAADDVVLTDWDAPSRRRVDVRAIDATTKAPIPSFYMSLQGDDPLHLQGALFSHYSLRRLHAGKAQIELTAGDSWRYVVVSAPEHGFEVAPLPTDGATSLVVTLGPESSLEGRVLDAETGEPLPGVAVRALPKPQPTITMTTTWRLRDDDPGPVSDERGSYRIGGLRPGDYVVQTHAAGRPASDVFSVSIEAGASKRLDLTVPKQRWLELELVGTIPDGPACRLSIVGTQQSSSHSGFDHDLVPIPPVFLANAGKLKLGPVGRGKYRIELVVPSRTRTATGTTVQLGDVDPDRGPTRIALPDLTRGILRGRVVAGDVPNERLAILASPTDGRRMPLWDLPQPNVAGVEGDGSFAIDLPAGPYCLQLVDLLTGIVFHTEAEDVRIDESPKPIDIRPTIRWLEIECVPKQAGDEVVLLSLGVTLPRPRNGACDAFLRSGSRTNNIETGGVPFRLGATRQRWLVPEGAIEIKAMQTFEPLMPWSRGWGCVEVDAAKVEIDKPEQKITLAIPAPPSDQDLLRR
jgi:hypothetical protein